MITRSALRYFSALAVGIGAGTTGIAIASQGVIPLWVAPIMAIAQLLDGRFQIGGV